MDFHGLWGCQVEIYNVFLNFLEASNEKEARKE
jgi:hypothetical protein